MKKKKDEDVQITPEEKEMLRRLMETPGIERKWDFFDQMNTDRPIPPPEFFMRGRPERRFGKTKKALKAGGYVASVLICALILTNFLAPETADADKKPFQMLMENIRNGFLEVKPEGEGDDVTAVETIITEESEIETAGLKVFPELLIPRYIPESYHFVNLVLQVSENSRLFTYRYEDDKSSLLKIECMVIGDDVDSAFNNLIEKSEDNGELLFKRDEINGYNVLTVWLSDKEYIDISAPLSHDTLELIYQGLK